MLFLSKFVSYLLLMIVIVLVAAVGFIIGRILKNSSKSSATNTVDINSVETEEK